VTLTIDDATTLTVGLGPSTPYDDALRTGAPCWVRGSDGAAVPLPVSRWLADADERDALLLDACGGATLDVGCGPGRLTVALAARGLPSLGLDVSAEAVRLARLRGASALHRDVFAPVPGARRWHHVLLADGNVGIGGDPAALLARAREVLTPGGEVVCEVERPGVGLARGTWRLEGPEGGAAPVTFPWARLGVDAVAAVATTAGLHVRRVARRDGRWVAVLGAGPS
jgi:SAM-dependent methyltransferase